MEAKRSNLQTLQKAQSSKTNVVKTASELSLTPSQAAEKEKQNARKNPLDALSRTAIRQPSFEKRSGLQDVDEDYLKNNVFARSNNPKHSGLGDGVYGSRMQAQNPNAPMQQNAMPPNEMGNPQTPSQAQMHAVSQQQQQQQQNAQAPHQNPSQMQAQQPQTQVLSQPHQPGQQQQQQQGHMHGSQQQMHANNPQMTASQMQCKNQSQSQSQSQSHTQQQQPGIANNEPEMCTTCPNCQTTIYLVRGNEESNVAPAGYSNVPHENAMKTAVN